MLVRTQDGVFQQLGQWLIGKSISLPRNPSDEILLSLGLNRVLTDIVKPTFDPITQTCVEDYALVNGQWQINWTVLALPAEEVTVNQAAELARTRQQYIAAVLRHLDTVAKQRNYDSIISACSYATSTNPTFAAEAQACVAWRDAVWVACYQIDADVANAVRPVMTVEELLAELPVIAWPA